MPPKSKQQKEEEFIEMQRKKKTTGVESESIFKSTKSGQAWNDLVGDYERVCGRKPEDDGALVFPSHESAETFFTEQAGLKRDFLVSQLTEDRKPTGYNFLSCGDGHLYKGSFAEIKQQLEAALAKKDSSELRKGLKTIESHLYRNEVAAVRGKVTANEEPVRPPINPPAPGN